jgi:acylphosphatase
VGSVREFRVRGPSAGRRGRVQGVNYRARVAGTAHRCGVAGCVTHRADGTVFIDVQGDLGVVDAFLQDVSGPRGAGPPDEVLHVTQVAIEPTLVCIEIVRG